jgi:hypothetical protein
MSEGGLGSHFIERQHVESIPFPLEEIDPARYRFP